MLFRTNTGTLIEVKKYEFLNDILYYKKLMEIKKPIEENFFAKLEKTFNNKK